MRALLTPIKLFRSAPTPVGGKHTGAFPVRHAAKLASTRQRQPRATRSPGNTDVLRRFEALQKGLEDFEAADDFLSPTSEKGEAALPRGPSSLRPSKISGNKALSASLFTRVNSAKYVGSAVTLKGCPPPSKPEFAVVGRSNVGKSSLVNMLTASKNLALISKKPGKTRTINHFLINDSWYLVDLPGYGYAKSSLKDRDAWNAFTKAFFRQRETLVSVMLLIDASIPPPEMDIACAQWLHKEKVPYLVVFTKADKRSKGDSTVQNVQACLDLLVQVTGAVPDAFLTSAVEGSGGRDVLQHLAERQACWAEERDA